MRLLLTGATGFVGSRVLESLIRHGSEIHAVSRRPFPRSDLNVTWHVADLLQYDAIAEVVSRVRATHLLHCAWYTEHGRFWTATENLHWLSCGINLVREFVQKGGRRVVLAGSCAEYDFSSKFCDDAGPPSRPSTLYGVTKQALWEVTARFAAEHGVSAATGRIFQVYGPGEPAGRLIPAIIDACLAGVPARCTTGAQLRDFLHVEDVGGALAALAASSIQGPVNIGSGQPLTVADVARQTAAIAGRPDLLELGAIPCAPHDSPHIIPRLQRLREELLWTPSVDLETGLTRYVTACASIRTLGRRDHRLR